MKVNIDMSKLAEAKLVVDELQNELIAFHGSSNRANKNPTAYADIQKKLNTARKYYRKLCYEWFDENVGDKSNETH